MEEQKPTQDYTEQDVQEQAPAGRESAAAHQDVCHKETEEWKNRFIALNADLENFKRRTEKEKVVWTRFAQAEVFQQLLQIVDDFDRALTEHKKNQHNQEMNAWLVGFEMIGKALHKMLEGFGVRAIDNVEVFDPLLHEAVLTVESPTHKTDDVVQVLVKGYLFKDEVLRPAKVSVAK